MCYKHEFISIYHIDQPIKKVKIKLIALYNILRIDLSKTQDPWCQI